VTCVKLKKIAYSPSAWAQHLENDEAAKILAAKGL